MTVLEEMIAESTEEDSTAAATRGPMAANISNASSGAPSGVSTPVEVSPPS